MDEELVGDVSGEAVGDPLTGCDETAEGDSVADTDAVLLEGAAEVAAVLVAGSEVLGRWDVLLGWGVLVGAEPVAEGVWLVGSALVGSPVRVALASGLPVVVSVALPVGLGATLLTRLTSDDAWLPTLLGSGNADPPHPLSARVNRSRRNAARRMAPR